MRILPHATIVLLAVGATATAEEGRNPKESVVKILTTQRKPLLDKPWAKDGPQELVGSGVILDGPRILTNAHVVMHSNQIYVQADESTDKVSATIEAIAPGIDLAVLKVDAAFFQNRPTLVLAEDLPAIKDKVSAYGYPTGGAALSVTEGIVSRIEFTNYDYHARGLRIQVDAALNSGNSGGPVLSNGRVIGIVHRNMPLQQKIGFVIPAEEIRLFLEDIRDGRYDGNPSIFDYTQDLENPALREKLGLDPKQTGVMVTQPMRRDPAYPLRTGDVILRIGPHAIANDATVVAGTGLRFHFVYYVPRLAKDGRVELSLLREGKEMTIRMPVSSEQDMLAKYLLNEYPSYFICGPFVFAPMYVEFLAQVMSGQLSIQGSTQRALEPPAFDGEEMVTVVSAMFPHRIMKGYVDPPGHIFVLKEVDGVRIRNLRHLVETLRDTKGTFVTFTFEGHFQSTMVFRREELHAATDEILTDNGIRHQCSDNLRATWRPPR